MKSSQYLASMGTLVVNTHEADHEADHEAGDLLRAGKDVAAFPMIYPVNSPWSPSRPIERDLVVGPIAAGETVQAHAPTRGRCVHKTAITHVNTCVGTFVAFAKDNQIT